MFDVAYRDAAMSNNVLYVFKFALACEPVDAL